MAAQELFKSPEDSVVIKSTALDDDVLAKFCRVFDFDNFIKGIFMTE